MFISANYTFLNNLMRSCLLIYVEKTRFVFLMRIKVSYMDLSFYYCMVNIRKNHIILIKVIE